MAERVTFPDTIERNLSLAYDFLSRLYPVNWKVRFGSCPYMGSLSQQEQIDAFISQYGVFESIAGHVHSLGILDYFIRKSCPTLRQILDPEKVQELILFHDIREAKRGDTSIVQQILNDNDAHLDQERKDLEELLKVLPLKIAKHLLVVCDAFEGKRDSVGDFEIKYVRLLDTMQSGNCVLTFGNNLAENSRLIEKVMRRRTAPRAQELIDALFIESRLDKGGHYTQAANEVKQIADFHIGLFRKQGVVMDLQDFGF